MHLTDDEINERFSLYQSERNKSVEYRKKIILLRFTKWEDNYREMVKVLTNGSEVTREYVDSLTDEQTHWLFLRMHGVNTIRNFDRSAMTGRNSWFMNIFVSDLKYNADGLTCVRTRSGLEAKMIKVLEENKVVWSYEKLRILALDKSGFYIPDFIATIDGTTYIIETKGSFYRQDEEHYIKNKAAAAHAYAKERGWKYCMVFKEPKDLKFIETALFLGE